MMCCMKNESIYYFTASACTMYSKPARGYWTEELKSYYYAREVINFECDDLHENVTLKTVQCLVTGMWDILFPGCVCMLLIFFSE